MKKIKIPFFDRLPKGCRIPCGIVLFGVLLTLFGKLFSAGSPSSAGAGGSAFRETAKAGGSFSAQMKEDGAAVGTVTDWRIILEYHESRLEAFIRKIKGAGDATVLVECDSSSMIQLVENSTLRKNQTQEADNNGGTRTVTEENEENAYLIVKDQSGNERVVAVSETLPAITAVCVVCKGGGQSAVQERIISALRVLYGLPASRIVVLAGA